MTEEPSVETARRERLIQDMALAMAKLRLSGSKYPEDRHPGDAGMYWAEREKVVARICYHEAGRALEVAERHFASARDAALAEALAAERKRCAKVAPQVVETHIAELGDVPEKLSSMLRSLAAEIAAAIRALRDPGE